MSETDAVLCILLRAMSTPTMSPMWSTQSLTAWAWLTNAWRAASTAAILPIPMFYTLGLRCISDLAVIIILETFIHRRQPVSNATLHANGVLTCCSIVLYSAKMQGTCRNSNYGLTEKRAIAFPAKTIRVRLRWPH